MKFNIQKHKLFLVVVFSTFVLAGKSQIKIGLKGGVGITDQYGNIFSIKPTTTNKVSFNIGMASEKEINRSFSISAEINYVVKGSKMEVSIDKFLSPSDPDTLSTLNSTLYYLELPVDFVGKIVFQNKSKIAIGGGPYIAYGIAGKKELDYDKTSWDPFKGSYQRLDFGGNIFLAYEISKIKISLSYSNSLTDISAGDDILKNRYGGVNICYYFGQL
jgi:hypothetical protein